MWLRRKVFEARLQQQRGARKIVSWKFDEKSIKSCWSKIKRIALPVKTCPTLQAPANGRIRCEYDDENSRSKVSDKDAQPIDTRCQFKCDNGYQVRGSKVRNCLPLSRWDGLKTSCKRKDFHWSTPFPGRPTLNQYFSSLIYIVHCSAQKSKTYKRVIPSGDKITTEDFICSLFIRSFLFSKLSFLFRSM